MASLRSRIQNAWSVFNGKNKNEPPMTYGMVTSSSRPDRVRTSNGNDRSIITALFNRIASDAASIRIEHVKLDDAGRYESSIDSGLNNCLSLEANLDQTGRAFLIDVYMSMFDEGHVCIVPTSTSANIYLTNSFNIYELRVGKILEWMPNHVRVKVYNQNSGRYEELVVPKRSCAILENPFYATMNERSSILQRLIRKLNLLDAIDEQNSSGKFNMIIQLPYSIRTDTLKNKAEERRKAIEEQLIDSKYGIAYSDATEKITQLGRPLENNLMTQIEYLTSMLYSQLGFSTGILDGTADEKQMLNYNNNIVEPTVSTLVDELKRKFLTKTARSQRQSIMFFRDPFRLVPVNDVSEIADKFTRNEIMSSNEIRQVLGMKPINDPKADELRNKNLNPAEGQEFASTDDTSVQEVPDNDSKSDLNTRNDGSFDTLMQTPMSALME